MRIKRVTSRGNREAKKMGLIDKLTDILVGKKERPVQISSEDLKNMEKNKDIEKLREAIEKTRTERDNAYEDLRKAKYDEGKLERTIEDLKGQTKHLIKQVDRLIIRGGKTAELIAKRHLQRIEILKEKIHKYEDAKDMISLSVEEKAEIFETKLKDLEAYLTLSESIGMSLKDPEKRKELEKYYVDINRIQKNVDEVIEEVKTDIELEVEKRLPLIRIEEMPSYKMEEISENVEEEFKRRKAALMAKEAEKEEFEKLAPELGLGVREKLKKKEEEEEEEKEY